MPPGPSSDIGIDGSRLSIAILGAGFIFYVYIIIRALSSFFGKGS